MSFTPPCMCEMMLKVLKEVLNVTHVTHVKGVESVLYIEWPPGRKAI